MAVVALIPTGRLEHAAIGTALKRLFPNHEFVVRPRERNLDGFTSCDVSQITRGQTPIPTRLDELCAELVNAVTGGRRGEKIDFAFVVEDLELVNQRHPSAVIQLFRDAVRAYIDREWPQRSHEILKTVRERCSFHLFRPMTEAYFFGDAGALQRAGVQRSPMLPDGVDLEQFRTTDEDYLNLPAESQQICNMPERQFHPKHYLNFLCDPSLSDRSRRYRETKNGVAALELLDWSSVMSGPPHCPFLHALLDDLAEALDHRPAFVDSALADQRVRFPGPRERILRNL